MTNQRDMEEAKRRMKIEAYTFTRFTLEVPGIESNTVVHICACNNRASILHDLLLLLYGSRRYDYPYVKDSDSRVHLKSSKWIYRSGLSGSMRGAVGDLVFRTTLTEVHPGDYLSSPQFSRSLAPSWLVASARRTNTLTVL
jgi:hypothetical protein